MKQTYTIQFSPGLTGEGWIKLADAFEAFMIDQGYDVWEFNNKEIDRSHVVSRSSVGVLEGFVSQWSAEREELGFKKLVDVFLNKQGLAMTDLHIS